MTIKNQIEGTLPAIEAAIAAITPAVPADAGLLANAQSQIAGRLAELATASAADPAAPNGAIVSLIADGANFRCAFSIAPRKILV